MLRDTNGASAMGSRLSRMNLCSLKVTGTVRAGAGPLWGNLGSLSIAVNGVVENSAGNVPLHCARWLPAPPSVHRPTAFPSAASCVAATNSLGWDLRSACVNPTETTPNKDVGLLSGRSPIGA